MNRAILTGGNQSRSVLHLGEISRVGVVTLSGPQGHLYAVDLLAPIQHSCIEAPDFLSSNRSRILFALGVKCLWVAHLSILERAKIRFGIRSRHR